MFSRPDYPVKETTGKPIPWAVCVSTVEQKGSPPPCDLEQGIPDQEPQPPGKNSNSYQYPGPVALSLLTIGICLSVFLVSLDRTIITTAIPRITDDFRSTNSVGWYGSAYLIAACALQPTYGRIFTLFDIKSTYLLSVAIFEIGSLICAVAPNSTALIVGRAIAGWGSAGILTGCFVVVAHSVPLQKRPVYTAAVGMMFGVGAAVGPLLGGVFTGLATWRWCFYFNLPVGSVTLAVIALCFKPSKFASQNRPFFQRILQLDLIGNALLLGAFVMLFLALEFNGQQYPWSSPTLIGLLVGFGVALITFLGWQWHMKERALMVPSILLQRSVVASCLAALFIYATMLMHAYYLPIWFQAVKGASAVGSGVDMLAYTLSNAILSLLAGIVVTKTGYYAPPAIIGTAIATVGCGLLCTLQPSTPSPKWIGYQILASAGLGMAVQQGFIAVQRVLPLDQVPIATAAVTCFQSLGGAVFVSVGNNILQNGLLAASDAHRLPGVDIRAIVAAGATRFRSEVPEDSLPAVIRVYNHAFQHVFTAAVVLAGLALVSTLALEWKSVKTSEGDKTERLQSES
ncbi:hypothetical protein VTN02DRAFT_4422 [Thermoascus thermophilus]